MDILLATLLTCEEAKSITDEVEGKVVHDIAMSQKAVDIFDHYYDKYKKGFKWLKQAGGQLRPNLWNAKPPQRKKKKRSSAQPPEPPQ